MADAEELIASWTDTPIKRVLDNVWNHASSSRNSDFFSATTGKTGPLSEDKLILYKTNILAKAAAELDKAYEDSAPGSESFEEWRVTGIPGRGAAIYDFTYSPDRNPHLGDPGAAARKFARMIRDKAAEDPTYAWEDGPHLHMRRVTRSAWQSVEAEGE